MLSYILTEDHKVVPVDTDSLEKLMEWAKWFENFQNRQVASNSYKESEVSTVFLGLDHNFSGKGPPIVFESMVFGGPLNEEQLRYATWNEALAGHRKLFRRVIRSYTWRGRVEILYYKVCWRIYLWWWGNTLRVKIRLQKVKEALNQLTKKGE